MSDIKKFTKLIEKKGGQKDGLKTDLSWLINTIHGSLKVSIHGSDFTKLGRHRANTLASIFCRFLDPAGLNFVSKFYGRHSYSGKWNFHISGPGAWDEAVLRFEMELDKILPK